MPDVWRQTSSVTGPDTGGARHRVPPEKQVVAGADQAGVEQHRIDVAELAAPDAFRQQPAMKIQQRRDKDFETSSAASVAAFMQEIVISRFNRGNWCRPG